MMMIPRRRRRELLPKPLLALILLLAVQAAVVDAVAVQVARSKTHFGKPTELQVRRRNWGWREIEKGLVKLGQRIERGQNLTHTRAAALLLLLLCFSPVLLHEGPRRPRGYNRFSLSYGFGQYRSQPTCVCVCTLRPPPPPPLARHTNTGVE